MPATFYELVSSEKQLAIQKTDVWDFYRGQAEAAFPDDVVELLDGYGVNGFSEEMVSAELNWANSIDDPDRREQLLKTLKEEFSFLQSGGVVLSRTPAAFEAFRDDLSGSSLDTVLVHKDAVGVWGVDDVEQELRQRFGSGMTAIDIGDFELELVQDSGIWIDGDSHDIIMRAIGRLNRED